MSETVLWFELLLVALLVATIVKYIRLPYTLALVLAGVVVGILPHAPDLPVAPDLWLLLFLPPLLFEGSINMDLEILRRHGTPVGILAFAGTFISVLLLASVFRFLLGFDWAIAALLGVMLSPTDPVSVLALFKEYGVARGLQTLVEGESVFNDGVAVVLYLIALEVIVGSGHVGFVEGLIEFVKVVAGGALVGLILGYLMHRVYALIDDHLLEVGLSLALAYGAFLAAERLEVSGVIAVVVAGLIIGNYGRILSMSPSTRLSLTHFWEVAAFLINGVLFLLIGLSVERGRLLIHAGQIGIVFLAMVAVRGVTVYGLLGGYRAVARRSLPGSWMHATNWAGVRGSIPVALALGLPSGVPRVDQLRAITLGAVFLSLLVQGITIKPLLSRLGLIRITEEQEAFERAQGKVIAARAALSELDELHGRGEVSEILYETLRRHFEGTRGEASSELASTTRDYDVVRQRQLGRISARLFAAERAALNDTLRRGLLSEHVWRDLKRQVDARLIEGEEEGWEQVWREEGLEILGRGGGGDGHEGGDDEGEA
jgi:CPA1 family monovalent cation:H+ antiporter